MKKEVIKEKKVKMNQALAVFSMIGSRKTRRGRILANFKVRKEYLILISGPALIVLLIIFVYSPEKYQLSRKLQSPKKKLKKLGPSP